MTTPSPAGLVAGVRSAVARRLDPWATKRFTTLLRRQQRGVPVSAEVEQAATDTRRTIITQLTASLQTGDLDPTTRARLA